MLLSLNALKNCFGKDFLRNFTSTWNNLPKHCISANWLLIEYYLQSALRKELLIAPFPDP